MTNDWGTATSDSCNASYKFLVYMIIKITLCLLTLKLILLVTPMLSQQYFLIMSLHLSHQKWIQRSSAAREGSYVTTPSFLEVLGNLPTGNIWDFNILTKFCVCMWYFKFWCESHFLPCLNYMSSFAVTFYFPTKFISTVFSLVKLSWTSI